MYNDEFKRKIKEISKELENISPLHAEMMNTLKIDFPFTDEQAKSIGQRVRDARKASVFTGITQEKFAKNIGMNRSILNRLENGDVKTFGYLPRVAIATGTNLYRLMFDETDEEVIDGIETYSNKLLSMLGWFVDVKTGNKVSIRSDEISKYNTEELKKIRDILKVSFQGLFKEANSRIAKEVKGKNT
ncbi:helix-turn-helix transcriptional regulator [Vibrio parahaemolyticus]|nr:helix-turn-helix transcriptional regulator [Vibrio parahaemolyticus]